MRRAARIRIGLAAFALTLLFATGSSADCALSTKYRAMHGSVTAVSGGKLTLAQRGGDKVEFVKAGGVVVMGAKSQWSALATGDRAIVGWLISDNPAVAHEVCVLPGS